jgi:uncharacterized MAPEG superfamily protein
VSFELTLLVWSVLILFVHIGVQAGLLTRDLGREYNAGPRDEKRELSPVGGRAERALRNFLETWPAFIVLALTASVAGISSGLTHWGAGLYVAFRLAYIPLYLMGIPYVRSLAYLGACLGLLLMFIGIVF